MKHLKGSARVLTAAAVILLSFAAAPAGAQAPAAAQGCNNCHGANGVSTAQDVPTIAGMSATYLNAGLMAYKKKERGCPETTVLAGDKKGSKTDMCQAVAALSDADLAALSKYYAGQKFVPAAQSPNPALAAEGKKLHDQYCAKCHSKDGTDPADDAGILGGQWMPYLNLSFNRLKDGKQDQPDKMKALIDKMQQKHFDALVNFYAGVK